MRAAAIPVSATQAAFGLLGGAYLPFFVPSLENRGMDAATIGVMLALATALRIVVAPGAGLVADAKNDRRLVMLLFTGLGLVAFVAFALVNSVAAIFITAILANLLWNSPAPIVESSTLLLAERSGTTYGAIRVWASIAFVAGNVLSGFAVSAFGTRIIAPWFVVSAALGVIAIYAMPEPPGDGGSSVRQRLLSTLADARELVSKPVFLLFLAAAALIQGSHAFYYSYGGLHWSSQGLSATTIGLIWPLGVLAEIVLFVRSAPVVRRIGPVTLMSLGAVACFIRWTAMAFDPPLPILLVTQMLHGMTFAVPHLGAMYFILRATPPRLSATAQNLYSVVALGLTTSAALIPASAYYDEWGGRTYLLMSGMAVAAGLCTLLLGRNWNGGRLTERPLSDADRNAA